MSQTEEDAFQGAQGIIIIIDKLRSDLETPCQGCREEAGSCPRIQGGSDRLITICQSRKMAGLLIATLSFLTGREVTFGEKTAFAMKADAGVLE